MMRGLFDAGGCDYLYDERQPGVLASQPAARRRGNQQQARRIVYNQEIIKNEWAGAYRTA
jgi:hypothetical protein